MLDDILTLDQQWLPNQSDFPPISWPWYRLWPSPNYEWFPWSICNGCGMPAGNAYPSGRLVPSPIVGLANAPIVETKFLELAMSLLDFSPRIPLGNFSILLETKRDCVINQQNCNSYQFLSILNMEDVYSFKTLRINPSQSYKLTFCELRDILVLSARNDSHQVHVVITRYFCKCNKQWKLFSAGYCSHQIYMERQTQSQGFILCRSKSRVWRCHLLHMCPTVPQLIVQLHHGGAEHTCPNLWRGTQIRAAGRHGVSQHIACLIEWLVINWNENKG